MIRNEILEPGQKVLLYHNGLWYGKSEGLGTLIKRTAIHSNEEWWKIVLENGTKTNWSMLSTDEEVLDLNNNSQFWHGDAYMHSHWR